MSHGPRRNRPQKEAARSIVKIW